MQSPYLAYPSDADKSDLNKASVKKQIRASFVILSAFVSVLVLSVVIVLSIFSGSASRYPSSANSLYDSPDVFVLKVNGKVANFTKDNIPDFVGRLADAAGLSYSNLKLLSIQTDSVATFVKGTSDTVLMYMTAMADNHILSQTIIKSLNSAFSGVDGYTIDGMATLDDMSSIVPENTPVPTAAPVFDPVALDANGELHYYMNCGMMKGTWRDRNGTVWVRDQYYSAGIPWTTKTPTGNFMADTERGFQMLDTVNEGYHIPVPKNGVYLVRFHIAEVFSTVVGYRKFDVYAEKVAAATTSCLKVVAQIPGVPAPTVQCPMVIDPLVAAGGFGRVFTFEKTVTITDRKLDITFVKVRQNPKLSGIEIHSISI